MDEYGCKDMGINQSIMVQLVWGEQRIEFATDVLEQDSNGVIIAPYLHNNAQLELNVTWDKPVVCNIFATNPLNQQRISWKNVELVTMKRGEAIVYHIKSNAYNAMAIHDDRRKNARVIVRVKGQVYDTSGGYYLDVLIHDISDVGISFYAPSSFTPLTPQLIVVFTDVVNDKQFDLKVDCVISRTHKKAGNNFYGCRIVGEKRDYLLYGFLKRLNEKSRARMDVIEDGATTASMEKQFR